MQLFACGFVLGKNTDYERIREFTARVFPTGRQPPRQERRASEMPRSGDPDATARAHSLLGLHRRQGSRQRAAPRQAQAVATGPFHVEPLRRTGGQRCGSRWNGSLATRPRIGTRARQPGRVGRVAGLRTGACKSRRTASWDYPELRARNTFGRIGPIGYRAGRKTAVSTTCSPEQLSGRRTRAFPRVTDGPRVHRAGRCRLLALRRAAPVYETRERHPPRSRYTASLGDIHDCESRNLARVEVHAHEHPRPDLCSDCWSRAVDRAVEPVTPGVASEVQRAIHRISPSDFIFGHRYAVLTEPLLQSSSPTRTATYRSPALAGLRPASR